MKITEDMINRFLSWPLPASVCADLCATQQGAPHRTGTSLLSATEARQMLEHVLSGEADALAAWLAEGERDNRLLDEHITCCRAENAEKLVNITELQTENARLREERNNLWDDLMARSNRIHDLKQQLAAAQGTWTTEKPTEAGAYWFKEPNVAPYPVRVGTDGHGVWVWWESNWQLIDEWNGEWCRIAEPREA